MDLTVLKLHADVRYKTSLLLDRYTENITKIIRNINESTKLIEKHF